jgi:hypothetical protein
VDKLTPPQPETAVAWQGQASGEAFAGRLRERADSLDLPTVIGVQPWEQSGAYGVSVAWGNGPEQAVMYEVADWVDGCRVLDHHGADLTVAQGVTYFEAVAAGMSYRQALSHADPSRASFLSRWREKRRRR